VLNLLVIPELVSVPDIISSSTALSWPHGTEFADSRLKLITFSIVSLICTDSDHYYLFEDVPLTILQRLADLDYRKPLIAMGMVTRRDNPSSHDLFNLSASVRTLSHTRFEWIGTENWLLLHFFWYVSNMIIHTEFIQSLARLSINWRKQRSSGHTFLSLDRAVPQLFFTFSPAKR